MPREQLEKWLSETARWRKAEDFVLWQDAKPHKCICHFYTREHHYQINAMRDSLADRSYLGCGVSSRKPRAGEDWTRGNDLADGKFTDETWQQIKNDIIAYELVKIARRGSRVKTEEGLPEYD